MSAAEPQQQQAPAGVASQMVQVKKRPLGLFVQPTVMSVSAATTMTPPPATLPPATPLVVGKRRRLSQSPREALAVTSDSPPPVGAARRYGNSADDRDVDDLNNGGGGVVVVVDNCDDGSGVNDDVLADVLGESKPSASSMASASSASRNGLVSFAAGPGGHLHTVTVRLTRPSAASAVPTTTVVVSPSTATSASFVPAVGEVVDLSGNDEEDDDADDDDNDEEDENDDDAIVGQLLSDATPTSSTSTSPACAVCGAVRRVNIHYGVLACESCRNFFKRALANQPGEAAARYLGVGCIRGDNRCDLTPSSRSDCKSCRLRKCLAVGMSRESCKLGRRPLAHSDASVAAATVATSSDDSLSRARALSDLQLQEALQMARAEDRILHRRVGLRTQASPPPLTPSASGASPTIEIIRELPDCQDELKAELIDQCLQLAEARRQQQPQHRRSYSRESISQLVRQLSPAVLLSVGQRDAGGRAQFCAQLLSISGNLASRQPLPPVVVASEFVVREEVVCNESDTDSDVEQKQRPQSQLPPATVIKLMPQPAAAGASSSGRTQAVRSQLVKLCHSMADEDFKILPVQREYCRDLLAQMISQVEDPVLDSVVRRRQALERLGRELVKISLEIMASGKTARNLVPFGYAPTSIVEQLQLYFKIVFGPDMLQEIVQSSQDLKNTPPQMDSTENFRDYLWNLYVFRMNFILSKVCDFAVKFGEFHSLPVADRCQIVLSCFKAAAILIHSQFWVVSPACYLLVQDRSLSLADMKAHFLYGDEFVRLSFEFTKDLVELRLKEEEFVIFLTLVIFFFDTGNSLVPDLSGRGLLTGMKRQLFSKLERVVGQQRRYLRVLQLWRSLKKLVSEEDRCVADSAGKIVDKCLQHYTSGGETSNAIRLYPDLFLTKQTHLVKVWLTSKS